MVKKKSSVNSKKNKELGSKLRPNMSHLIDQEAQI